MPVLGSPGLRFMVGSAGADRAGNGPRFSSQIDLLMIPGLEVVAKTVMLLV